jgi:hypothetical protein
MSIPYRTALGLTWPRLDLPCRSFLLRVRRLNALLGQWAARLEARAAR